MRARIEDNGKKSCGTWDLVSLTGGDDEVETKMLHLVLIKQHTMHKTTRRLRRSKRPFGEKKRASERGWKSSCDFKSCHSLVLSMELKPLSNTDGEANHQILSA